MNAILRQVALSLESDRLFPFIAEVIAGACLLVIVAAAISWALRHKSASVRHHVWAAAIVALLLAPIAKLFVPAQLSLALWNAGTNEATLAPTAAAPNDSIRPAPIDPLLAGPPTPNSIDSALPEQTENLRALEAFKAESHEQPIANARTAAPFSLRSARWFVGVWLAGALLTFAPYLKSTFGIRRTIAHARQIPGATVS
jgi:hypothetical protein